MSLDRDFPSTDGLDSEDESLLRAYSTKKDVEGRSTVQRVAKNKALFVSLVVNLVLVSFVFVLLLVQTKRMGSLDNMASHLTFSQSREGCLEPAKY